MGPLVLQPPPAPRHPLSVGLKARAGVVLGVVSIVVAMIVAAMPARRGERPGRLATAAVLAAAGVVMAGASRIQVRRHRRAVSAVEGWGRARGWVVDGPRMQGTYEGLPMAIRVGYSRRGAPVAVVCELGGHRPGWWALIDERFDEGGDDVATRIDALCAGARRAS